MPNWVTTIVELEGSSERIEEVRNFVKNDEEGNETEFDFNKVIPMPKDLMVESSSRAENAMDYILGRASQSVIDCVEKMTEEQKAEYLADGQKYIDNQKKYGFTNWYEWRIANWGTKWNSSDAEFDGNCITMDTAWSCPAPVIHALAHKFPDIRFTFKYADEDAGCNTGIGEFYVEKQIEEFSSPDNNSLDSCKIYLDVKGCDGSIIMHHKKNEDDENDSDYYYISDYWDYEDDDEDESEDEVVEL